MRTTLPALAIAFCCLSAVAQSPIERLDRPILKEIEERLASENAADVAWGGYLANHYRVRGATRALCEALATWKKEDSLKARIVRLHLADGLIGCGAKVPAEQVAFLLDDVLTRHAAFAVVANDPYTNREALTQLALAPAPNGDLVRVAAGRLLIARNLSAPKLGAFAIENLECRLTMVVRDDKTEEQMIDGAIGLGGRMVAPARVGTQEGFPPMLRIQLTDWGDAEDTIRMVVPSRVGDGPIYLTRQEKVTFTESELEPEPNMPVHGEDELVILLREMSGVRITPRTFLRHSWQGAAGCKAAFEKERDRIRRRLDNAVAQLRRRGWLGKKDLEGFRIELKEIFVDERGDQSTALPEIAQPPAIGQ